MQAGVYRHYKGGYYQLLGVADWSGNIPALPISLKRKYYLAVYISLTGAHLPGPRMRVRPLDEFEDNDVELPDGTWAKRFTYVGDEVPADAEIPLSGRPSPLEPGS